MGEGGWAAQAHPGEQARICRMEWPSRRAASRTDSRPSRIWMITCPRCCS
jgi:hypothetical protein